MMRPCLTVVTAALAFALVHNAHKALAPGRVLETQDETIYVPDGASLRMLSMGQSTTLADLYWLRFVQYVGTPANIDAGLPQAFSIADVITDLDPRYGFAYQAAGISLNSAKQIDDSIRILEKGLDYVPERWQIPFYLSFNHWYERNELEQGARLLERAASLPSAPAFVPRLVARLYSADGKAAAAKAFFEAMLHEAQDPITRSEIESRLTALHIETDIVLLLNAVEQFRMESGRYPDSLDALVGVALAAIPVSPNGVPYAYDPETGAVVPPEGLRLGRSVSTAVTEAKARLEVLK